MEPDAASNVAGTEPRVVFGPRQELHEVGMERSSAPMSFSSKEELYRSSA